MKSGCSISISTKVRSRKMKFLSLLKRLFEKKEPIILSKHKKCFERDGTGEYAIFIDCLICDGKGYIKDDLYYKMRYGDGRED